MPNAIAGLEMIAGVCALAKGLGFEPHTNAGPLSPEEMQTLAPLNASMVNPPLPHLMQACLCTLAAERRGGRELRCSSWHCTHRV